MSPKKSAAATIDLPAERVARDALVKEPVVNPVPADHRKSAKKVT